MDTGPTGGGGAANPAADFSLGLIPDTQNYVSAAANRAIMGAQTQWLVDNRAALNLKFVSHLGDIVGVSTSQTQWQAASQYMATLEAAGVPNTVLPGNHDMNVPTGAAPEYLQHFPASRYAAASWNGIGWLAWSWSGNGGGGEYLDMVTAFDPARPTTWGQRIIDGPNGLRATAREASVYGTGPGPSPTGPSPTVSPTPTPTPTPPPGACTAAYRVVNQWQGGFQAEVTVTAGSAAIPGWTVGWALSAGQGVASWWNGTLTTAAGRVTARNVDHNGRLAAGARTAFGFIGSGPAAGTPALSCAAAA